MRCLYVKQTVFPHFCLTTFRSKAVSQSSSLFPIFLSGSPFSHHSGMLVSFKYAKHSPCQHLSLCSLCLERSSLGLCPSLLLHAVFYTSGSLSKRSLLLPVSAVFIFPPLTLHPSLRLDLATLALSFPYSQSLSDYTHVYHHYSLDLGCLLKVHHQLMQC